AIDHASENNRDVQVTRGLLQITIDETTITNNYQDKVTRKGTKINWYLMTKPTKGGTGTGSESQQVRSWKELDFEKIPELAAEKAITYQNAKPIKSTKLPVIFVNKFNAQMLGLMLGPNINSEWILKGRSTFRDKLNKQIAHENFSIQDSALLAAGYESRPFDDEGHPTQKTSIIKDGKLKNFIYDTYYAKRAETKSTGNAFRNYDSIPSPSTNNLILSNGSQEIDEIIAETKKGLYVEKTIGHWLSKPTSGELSATVTHGLLIEDGEFTDPIGNVVISGNFFDILQNKIAAIGKDKKNSGKYYSPSIKISEMSIAGK
ncbi:MAG: metallopeptidase TldD-related protein, partial [Asgard group archaeon]|nr:metallopeptidase TldD-related protein [Asgard group archaeon]